VRLYYRPYVKMSRTRLWLERIGVGLIAVVSLSAPFVFGVVYYLGVTDGIEFSPGDPMHESRLWMQKDRHGPTGIGWLRTAPAASTSPGLACATSQLTLLNWQGGLSLDTSTHYCKCYEGSAGSWKEAGSACS